MSARLQLALAIVLGALGIAGIVAPSSGGQALPSKPPAGAGAGNPAATFPSSRVLAAEGFDLYQQSCSSCHGVALGGVRGTAPSLRGVGAGPVDFYLSTGRMPLANPREQPSRSTPLFDRRQIAAIVAYIQSFGGPRAPSVDPAAGNLSAGRQVFTTNCAGCHQIVGRGGLTLGAFVPNLQQATAQQIAEAVRMGPYVMPRFDSKQIDQRQLNSLVRYVLWTRHPDNAGGWGIYNIGPIPEGIVAWFVAAAALLIVARLIGQRIES